LDPNKELIQKTIGDKLPFSFSAADNSLKTKVAKNYFEYLHDFMPVPT